MDELERTLREFIPHSVSYCISSLHQAILSAGYVKIPEPKIITEYKDKIPFEEMIKNLGYVKLSDVELDIESICEKVHQAYCKYHLENKGTEYWTKGDYSKLTEEGKEYDRRTVRAVFDAIAQAKDYKVI